MSRRRSRAGCRGKRLIEAVSKIKFYSHREAIEGKNHPLDNMEKRAGLTAKRLITQILLCVRYIICEFSSGVGWDAIKVFGCWDIVVNIEIYDKINLSLLSRASS